MHGLTTFLPHPWLSLLLAVVAAAGTAALVRFAARRSLAQPLAMELAAETEFLTGVLADVRRLPYVTSLTPEDFAAGAHQRIWKALIGAAPECANLPDDRSEEDCAAIGAVLADRRDEVLADVWTALQAGPAPQGDGLRLRSLLVAGTDQIGDVAVVEAGHKVLYAGQDRNHTAGAGLVLPTATPDSADPASPPLARVYTPPSRTRTIFATAASTATAALMPAFITNAGYQNVAAALAGVALAALLALSIVISLVDLDTMYVDVRTFLAIAPVAWAATVAAALVHGSPGRLIAGIAIVAAVAALFEIANRLYRAVRGTDGQGLGDSLIVLATVAIPPALTGAWTLGYYSLMAGMLAAVAGWTVGAWRGKLSRTTPYAFGPYLAAGWVIGWVAFLI